MRESGHPPISALTTTANISHFILCLIGLFRTGFALGLFVVAVDDHVAVQSPDGQEHLSRNQSMSKFTA